MNQQLKLDVIETFKRNGADIVRFGSASKMTDAAVKKIFPEAKTVIAAAFRQLRGTRRGIEEGTTYYQYTTNAVEVLEENVMPCAMLKVCSVIEKAGFDALPQRRNQTVMQSDSEDTTNFEINYRDVKHGCKAENQLDFERCAVDCGLGEQGLSGSILTDDFGPFQRFCFILTDAEIEPDEPAAPHLCDHCKECIRHCPGHALSEEGKRDSWQCAVYYNGANMSRNPFMPPDAFIDDPERLKIISGEAEVTPERAKEILSQMVFYPPMKHSYWASICGRACDMACYVHLEEKGVLKRKFRTPFRKRPEWKLSID